MRIAFREWKVYWDDEDSMPILRSLYQTMFWPDSRAEADRLPSTGTLYGIHAVLPEYKEHIALAANSPGRFQLLAIGAIDLSGEVVEHENGIVRAQQARVLAVRVIFAPVRARCGHPPIGMMIEPTPSRRFRSLVTTCFGTVCDQRGELKDLDLQYEYAWPLLADQAYTVREIEQGLIHRYEVPRLPDGVGPWRAPVGSR